MASTADVIAGVRQKMRDFPKMFQTDIQGDGLAQIFEMPVIMVEAAGLTVNVRNTATSTPQTTALTANTDYTLDAHHGALMLLNNRILQSYEALNVFGLHYEWFLDSDISSEATWFVQSLEVGMPSDYFDNMALDDPVVELAERGTLLGCLWSLLVETSLDIDVRNPEGVDIPTSQRFNHLQGLVEQWTERYQDLASKLNVGIDKISILTLRRISYSTGRLVPLYVSQEFDDRATPQRLYPPIDSGQGLPTAAPPNTN